MQLFLLIQRADMWPSANERQTARTKKRERESWACHIAKANVQKEKEWKKEKTGKYDGEEQEKRDCRHQ